MPLRSEGPGAPPSRVASMSEPEDLRIRRLAIRSWRRGTKEMDLILGPFSDTELAGLTGDMLDRYDALLSENDIDLYRWTSRQSPTPNEHRAMLEMIRRFHRIS